MSAGTRQRGSTSSHRPKRPRTQQRGGVVMDRFWAKVDRSGPLPAEGTLAYGSGHCWLWRSSPKRNRYPTFWSGRAYVSVHRFVYEQVAGPIPKGHQIDHLCGVTNCVRPDHLEAVTPKTNVRRFWSTKRYRRDRGLPPLVTWWPASSEVNPVQIQESA